MDNPHGAFILQYENPEAPFYLYCRGCPRDPADCGPDRNKLAPEARAKGYKLVPGLGWLCHDCFWATELEVTISGSIETNPR